MKSKRTIVMDETFFGFDENKQMSLLGINEETFSIPKFRGLPRNTVISDIWNGKTNSERRKLLK